jgi:hypothetical protein
MANLKATTVTSGIVSEKIGTTPTDTTVDHTNDMFAGATERAHDGFAGMSAEAQPKCQFDPHNSRRFVLCYQTNGGGACRIGLISGTEITYSNEYLVFSTNLCREIMFAFDPSVANKFVVVYRSESESNRHRCRVGTISALTSDPTGFQISFGTNTSVGNYAHNAHYNGDMEFDPNVAGRFSIISSSNSQGYVIAGQVDSSGTGTTISFGTDNQYAFAQVGGNASDMRLAYNPSTANRFTVVWRDTVNTWGFARTLDVHTSTLDITRSYQYDQYFYQGDIRWPSIAFDPNTANKFVISFVKDDDGDKGVLIVGTQNSGGDLSLQQPVASSIFNNAATSYTSVIYDTTTANRVIVAYEDDADSNKGKAIVGTIDYSGPTITSWGSESTFNASGGSYSTIITTDSSFTGRFIVGWREGSYPNYSGKVITGKIKTETLSINLTTGSFFTLDMQGVGANIDTFTTTGTATGVTIFDLRVIQGSTARQFDWDAMSNVKWVSAPTLSTTNDAVDVYSFTTYDNGTTWYGEIVGQDIR